MKVKIKCILNHFTKTYYFVNFFKITNMSDALKIVILEAPNRECPTLTESVLHSSKV